MMPRLGHVACALLFLAAGAPAQAEDASINAARELYASAAYEDALRMLDGLEPAAESAEDRQAIGLYRILCLIALGHADQAEQAFETLVVQEPLFRPSLDELAPRVRTAFVETRTRLLPAVVQQRYGDAKAAYDRGDFAAASAGFKLVLDVLADPMLADAAARSPLSDLRTLAAGFHDLAVEALTPPPPAPLPAPAPVVIVAAPPSPPARDYHRVYTATDASVVPPTPIKQTFPAFSGRVVSDTSGVIDVLIDATGDVEQVTIRQSIDPRYDAMLRSAAQRWEYKPATVDGVPVKFLKTVQVNLTAERR